MKNNNLRFIMIGTLILMLIFIGACSSDDTSTTKGEKDKYTLKVPHVTQEDDPTHKAWVGFKEEVEEKSEGRIEVEIFPNGQLYDSEREMVEATQRGDIPIASVATPPMANFADSFLIFDLPYLVSDREEAYKVFDVDGEIVESLMEDLDEIGLEGFGIGELGFRHILNNEKPITKPEDLKGLKIRVPESELSQDTFNTLGANASPLGFGEVYSALQQGTYDALESTIALTASTQFYEVQDYFTLASYVYSGDVIFANKEYMDSLPDDLEDVVRKAGENYVSSTRELVQEEEEKGLEKLREEGMEINELSDEEKATFEDSLENVYDKYEDVIGKELLEMVEESKE